MTVRDKTTLKNYFKNGKVPNQQHYEDLIDSFSQAGGSVLENPMTDKGDMIYADESINVAAGMTVWESDNSGYNWGPQYITSYNGRWESGSAPSSGNAWFYIDLVTPRTIGKWEVSQGGEWGMRCSSKMEISYSNDGQNWTILETVVVTDGNPKHVLNVPIQARYWKFRSIEGGWDKWWVLGCYLWTPVGVPLRLPIGEETQHLAVVNGIPSWVDNTDGGGVELPTPPNPDVYLNGEGEWTTPAEASDPTLIGGDMLYRRVISANQNAALLSLGAQASAGYSYFSDPSDALEDTDSDYWFSGPSATQNWFLVDLGEALSVTHIRLVQGPAVITQYKIQVSNNGVDFVDLLTHDILSNDEIVYLSEPTVSRYWRFWPTAGYDFGWAIPLLQIFSGDSVLDRLPIGEENQHLVVVNGVPTWTDDTGGEGGGHVIQDSGTSLTQRSKLNFIGATVEDDSVNDSTKITIPTTGGGDLPSGDYYGAYLGRLSNLVINSEAPFPFTNLIKADPGFYDDEEPTKLTIQKTGWYWVGYDITTLGTGYGGANNAQLLIAVLKNWNGTDPVLNAMCMSRNFSHSNGGGAVLDSFVTPVYLVEGDVLQLIIQNPNASTVLVESNPSDGQPSGYLDDTGPGTLSPHFYVALFSTGPKGDKGDKGDSGGVTLPDPTDPTVYLNGEGEWTTPEGTGGEGGTTYAFPDDHILVQDQKAHNVNGGAGTASTWNTRTLNTLVTNQGGYASLANNQVTLQPGNYHFYGSAPAYYVGGHQIRLRDITHGISYVGSTELSYTDGSMMTRSVVSGDLVLTEETTFELQHWISRHESGYDFDFGQAANNDEISVYSILEFYRKKTSTSGDHILLSEVQSSGVNNGGVVGSTWNHRPINTIVKDSGNHCTLGTGTFSLEAGTYRIVRSGFPVFECSANRCRLYDVTNSVAVSGVIGPTVYTDTASMVNGELIGEFTLTGATELRVDHYTYGSRTAYGLGAALGLGDDEYFGFLELEKID